MNFFLEKQLFSQNKMFMYLLVPFILQNFKKTLWADSQDVPFLGLKWPFLTNKFFLVQTIIITLIHLLALFIVQNLQHFLQRIQTSEDAPFLAPKWSICPKQIFFGKLLISFSSTYQPLSLCKIFKKFFQQIQSYEDAQFLGPKWPISPNEKFFRKPFHETCFFHSCLFTCQKSKSDINLLLKY